MKGRGWSLGLHTKLKYGLRVLDYCHYIHHYDEGYMLYICASQNKQYLKVTPLIRFISCLLVLMCRL